MLNHILRCQPEIDFVPEMKPSVLLLVVLFLELKAPKGRLSTTQATFRDAVQAQGFGWALVRSLDDALGALADHGFTTRVVPQADAQRTSGCPARRTAP